MSKVTGARVARGAFWLSVGSGLGTVISAFATIIIARLLGPENYGAYSAALLLVTLLSISDIGLNAATTHYISESRAKGKYFLGYIKAALMGAMVTGSIIALTIIVFSDLIATLVFQKGYLEPLIILAAFMILGTAITNVVRGILLGTDKMSLIAFLTISSSIIRNFFAITLIILGLGAFGAMAGQMIGNISIAILGCLIVIFQIIRFSDHDDSIVNHLSELFSYGLPYAGGVFASLIFSQFYNVLAARTLDDFTYGNFAAAWMAYTGSTILIGAISSALFPNLTELFAADKKAVSRVFSYAVKYTSLVVLPIATIFMGISETLIGFFYGEKYALAASFLRLLSLSLLLSILGLGVSLSALLSLKRTKTIAWIRLVAILVSLFFVLLMYGALTAYTLIIAFVIMNTMSTIVSFLVLRRDYGVSLDAKFSIKALLAAFIALVSIWYLEQILNDTVITFLICVPLGILIYAFLISVLGALSIKDYENMKRYAAGTPLINRIILLVISYMEAIHRKFHKN